MAVLRAAMKEICISTVIPNCSVQRFHDLTYDSETPARAWHKAVNNDDNVAVTPWEDGVRTISFLMPLEIPDFLKRVANVTAVSIVEKQTLLWHNTSSFTVTSQTAILNVPGSSRFETTLSLVAREDLLSSACELQFTVSCTARLPWPLQATVENIMADKALASMQRYMAFCDQIVKEAGSGNLSAEELVHALSGTGAVQKLASHASFMERTTRTESQYADALEAFSIPSSPDSIGSPRQGSLSSMLHRSELGTAQQQHEIAMHFARRAQTTQQDLGVLQDLLETVQEDQRRNGRLLQRTLLFVILLWLTGIGYIVVHVAYGV